jgi:ATP-dependent RNA helicase RhlE
MTFKSLDIVEPILSALEHEGYTNPTPIQSQAIPPILQGRDLLGCAQTGTGKTAAFAIPVLQQLYNKNKTKGAPRIKALVLTPTRELAIQIDESFIAYGRNISIRSMVIFGGVSQHPQTQSLKRGVDVLIATPGRLLDLMNQGFIDLNGLEILVLDEADRMLDMGFIHDIRKILKVIPKQRQTLFFSATMPADIQELSESILKNPVKVSVTPVSSTAETIKQSVYFAEKPDKPELLIHLLKEKKIDHALVFTRTKHGADKIARVLTKARIPAEAIHGNKSQNARQRALSNFKDRSIRILVATDIAARGIDVDELSHVVNFDIPNIAETYVHRIGRTGRAGANGEALSLCDSEERAYLKDIQKLIQLTIPVAEAVGFELKTKPEAVKPAPLKQVPQSVMSRNVRSNSTAPPSKKKKWHQGRPNGGQNSRSH